MKEIDKTGGTILTSLILNREDLFEKCPPEIQKAIELYHEATNLMGQGKYNEGRLKEEELFELLHSKENIIL